MFEVSYTTLSGQRDPSESPSLSPILLFSFIPGRDVLRGEQSSREYYTNTIETILVPTNFRGFLRDTSR